MNDKNSLLHATWRRKYRIVIIPKYSVAEFMGYLKSKSTLMIFERHANMKYKFGNRKFWARGYSVDSIGKNEKAITEYIQNQLQEGKLFDQTSIVEKGYRL